MRVPTFQLRDGNRIPGIGLGTFGSDRYTAAQVAGAVREGYEIGFRSFDCASVYGNEDLIGEVFASLFHSGASREGIVVTSKLWNNCHNKVRESCEKSLCDLRLDYLDFYLIHWPFPNFHPAGADPGFRDPDATPYIHEAYMETWRGMEALVRDGLVRYIGTSNMTVKKLEWLLRDASILPAVNEMELHPTFQQPELFGFCRENGIVPVGYCPIGSPNRPERDKTPDDKVDLEEPVVVEIAQAHGIHPALVCLKWAVQRGQIPIPFSVNRDKNEANLRAVCEDPLTEAEMERLKTVDAGCRLIKGQVFLWPGAKDWRDLWTDDN
jgi:alcohol dehydrogenase (NADP+)